MRGISWLAEDQSASQKGLCCMELVSINYTVKTRTAAGYEKTLENVNRLARTRHGIKLCDCCVTLWTCCVFSEYSSITSTKSPSFYMTTISASLINLTALPPQSRDYSCYVIRPILTPPPLWLQKHTELRAHDFAHSPDLWRRPRLANVTCVWSCRLYGINPVILSKAETSSDTLIIFKHHRAVKAVLILTPKNRKINTYLPAKQTKATRPK